MQGETQPCSHQHSWVPLLGYRKLLALTGTLVEERKFCRKPELLSPPFPSSAGEAVSLTPFTWLLAGGQPPHAPHAVGPHCGRALGGCQGIPPPSTYSLLMPLWSLYPKLCTLLGAGKSEHGTALLPHSMHVAAGLRPPNSSRQWWRIADHTQSPTCPCSAPSLSPSAAHTSAEARGAAPGKSPDKHTTSMAAVPQHGGTPAPHPTLEKCGLWGSHEKS